MFSLMVAVWFGGNELVFVNEVSLRRAQLVLGRMTVSAVQTSKLSRCINSHQVKKRKKVRTSICIAHTMYCTPLMRSRH